MATECLSYRSLRRSLLASLWVHVIAFILLTSLWHSVVGGPGRTLTVEVGAAELFSDPEIFLGSEAPVPADTGDHLTVASDVIDPSDGTIETAAPELVALSSPDRSEVSPAEEPSSTEGATFFGTVANGDQFVYVVDISPSMNIGLGKGAGRISRLTRALAELRASIHRLSPEQSFYVILFHGETRRMFDDVSILPRALPATPDNKRRLDDWLASIRTGDSTDPRQALRIGLQMRPSALFLLSDGVFDVQELNVVQVIDRYNQGGTPIHTIAYEDARSCQTLERIARTTGGEYLFVPSASETAAREALQRTARYP